MCPHYVKKFISVYRLVSLHKWTRKFKCLVSEKYHACTNIHVHIHMYMHISTCSCNSTISHAVNSMRIMCVLEMKAKCNKVVPHTSWIWGEHWGYSSLLPVMSHFQNCMYISYGGVLDGLLWCEVDDSQQVWAAAASSLAVVVLTMAQPPLTANQPKPAVQAYSLHL